MSRYTVLPLPFQSPTSFYSVGIGEEKLKLRPEWAHIKERDMGHTPTPWTIVHEFGGSEYTINGADGELIANNASYYSSAPIDDDAAYIVECVNSHASLVEEVERLREALTTFVDEYVEMVNSGDCGFWDPEKEDKVVAARKALEKSNA